MMAAGKEGDNAAAMDDAAAENGEFVAVDPELLERGEEGRVAVGDYGRIIIIHGREDEDDGRVAEEGGGQGCGLRQGDQAGQEQGRR